jgi:hypothetical protein
LVRPRCAQIGFFQIATTVTAVIDAQWPTYFRRFLNGFDWANFDFIPWQSVECVTSLNFYHKFLATTLLPVVLLVVSAVVLGLFIVCDRRDFVSAELPWPQSLTISCAQNDDDTRRLRRGLYF